MSLEWYKNFKFREFDKEMSKKEISKGCEEVRLHQLNLQRQLALANFPDVSKLSTFWYSIYFNTCRFGA
jgi:hypothetical protein